MIHQVLKFSKNHSSLSIQRTNLLRFRNLGLSLNESPCGLLRVGSRHFFHLRLSFTKKKKEKRNMIVPDHSRNSIIYLIKSVWYTLRSHRNSTIRKCTNGCDHPIFIDPSIDGTKNSIVKIYIQSSLYFFFAFLSFIFFFFFLSFFLNTLTQR